jgi:hypothetical protein
MSRCLFVQDLSEKGNRQLYWDNQYWGHRGPCSYDITLLNVLYTIQQIPRGATRALISFLPTCINCGMPGKHAVVIVIITSERNGRKTCGRSIQYSVYGRRGRHATRRRYPPATTTCRRGSRSPWLVIYMH